MEQTNKLTGVNLERRSAPTSTPREIQLWTAEFRSVGGKAESWFLAGAGSQGQTASTPARAGAAVNGGRGTVKQVQSLVAPEQQALNRC